MFLGALTFVMGALVLPRAVFATDCTTNTNITWSPPGGQTAWSQTAGWLGSNVPDTTTEDAIIEASSGTPNVDANYSIGCLDISSGFLNTTTGFTLSVYGDYLRNLTAGSLSVPAGSTFTIDMAGTSAQTLENYDTLSNLTVSNNTSVTITKPFTLRNGMNISGTGSTVYVNANLTIQNGSAFTIGTGRTVEVGSGATLTILGGVSIAGTLKLNAGATLEVGSGQTVLVQSGGLLQLAGSSGNVATIKGNGNANYAITVDSGGFVSADYFRINHLGTSGLNVTGTIQKLDNGEFHYLAGTAVTLQSGATVPATMTSLGFFDDVNAGGRINFDSTAYSCGTARTVNNWSGNVGGESFDTDPGSCIDWGAQAGTKLTLSDVTASGSPPTTIGQSVGPSHFATFGFALTQTDTATDITQVKLTVNGTATAADISYIQVFKDVGGGTNCQYDAGTDTQIGSNLSVSGAPPTATVAIPAADVRTSGTTPACIHVLVRTTGTAVNNNTIAMQIAATADVTNSQGYSLSDTSGPPVSAGSSTIVGSAVSTWSGRQNTSWTTTNNWLEGALPTSTRDCRVGVGDNLTLINATPQSCQNATLQAGGSLDFAGAARTLAVYGSLTAQSGFTFSNAAAATLSMAGAGNQSLQLSTAFPGHLAINTAASYVTSVDANSTINGNLTVNTGTLRISSGVTLTVLGTITVGASGTLDIEPGATLSKGTGTGAITITGTLEMIGSSSQNATLTASSGSYTVALNGTIKAQYYSFQRLTGTGISIASGATIDTTYHLQNGTFSSPAASSTTFLTLNRQVPTDTMDSCTFDSSATGYTGLVNVSTSGVAAAGGPLTLNNYTGDVSGESFDVDGGSYAVGWGTQSNTIDVTGVWAGNNSVNQGETYTLGRFAFKQTNAGSFSTANITSLKLTLTGTATGSDISQARIYYDSDCDNSGGTLIGTQTFSGSPGTATFSITSGDAPVEASAGTPPTRCIYLAVDIASGASGTKTIQVKVNASTDLVNDQSYAISGGTPAPISMGGTATIVSTTTTWTGGAGTTNWFTDANWNALAPTSSMNCVIPSSTFNPVINAAGAVCKSITISTGTLTMTNGVGATLTLYGSLTNTGTLTQNDGIITFADTGSSTTQTIESSSTLGTVRVDKDLGGTLSLSSSSLSLGALSLLGTNTATLTIAASKTLTASGLTVTSGTLSVAASGTLVLTGGATVNGGTLTAAGGSTIRVASGQTLTVSSGAFTLAGTNDAYVQATSDKALITNNGSGTWGFSATGGTVSLTGFLLDYIDTSGLQISGTTTLASLSGGQFTHLPNAASNPGMRVIQINTSGGVPATASNVGFMWDDANSTRDEVGWCNCGPAATDNYTLVYAPACGGNTISFDQWFGDFFINVNVPATESKIYDTDDTGPTCQIAMDASASPVSLLTFVATGYDGEVSLDWVTASELDHAGFNVYRSDRPDSGYIQVNSALIRNFAASTSLQGAYRYVDSDVVNGRTYFYNIEDVSIQGAKEMHGPVSATPKTGLGSVPAAGGGTNGGTSSPGAGTGNSPSSGSIATPGLVDLGNGVHILARTRRTLRLEIVPPAATFAPAAWNGAYETISLPGYSSTLEAGKPELVERTVLVEVDQDLSTALVTGASVTEAAPATRVISPAPSWSINGSGVLVPSWSPDAAAYALNAHSPSSYYSVSASTEQIGNRNFVKVHVTPFQYNAVTQELKRASKIVLDIGLDGSDWAVTAPSLSTLSPSALEGVLRIRLDRTGVYQLRYEDLIAAGVEGPFAGADPAQFRLYQEGRELPIEVIGADASFSAGDAIRFYVIHAKHVDDAESEVVLSPINLTGTAVAPLRIQRINADPTSFPASNEAGTWRKAYWDQNNTAFFNAPLGDFAERFYWGAIYAERGQPLTSAAEVSVPLSLPGLLTNSPDSVRLKIHVKGGSGNAINPMHHLGVYVNNSYRLADLYFNEVDPTVLQVDVPANFFSPGANTVLLRVLADQVAVGDWDVVYVDRVEVDYRSDRTAVGGIAEIINYRLDHALTVRGFTNPVLIDVYDVTDLTQVKALNIPAPVTQDGGATYEIEFAASGGVLGTLGRRFIAFEADALPAPKALVLGYGAAQTLLSSSNGADLIVVGSFDLLVAASDLIAAREAQGLRVQAVPIEQVYAEFSHGRRTSQALRDFVRHARSTWQAPAPSYLLILGDATYDPRDLLAYGDGSTVMPIPVEKGLYLDFGNDNWFVASDSGMPQVAVGRIPTRSAGALQDYIRKLLDYEDGVRAPATGQDRKLFFVSDSNGMGEGFDEKSDALAAALQSTNATLTTARIDRTAAGNDANTKTQILSAFNEAPLAIAYLGHGAEDRWASGAVFTNADADALTNSRLPIVVALNCLNTYFYDADPTYDSLAERLLFNTDGGAIAFWGSTTMTLTGAQTSLAQNLLQRLAEVTREQPQTVRLGDLILEAKSATGVNASTRDAVRSFTLLGDPSMRIPLGAFSGVAPTPPPAPSASGGEDDSSGGFLGCGSLRSGSGGGGSGGNGRGAAEFALMMLIMVAAWRAARFRGRLALA